MFSQAWRTVQHHNVLWKGPDSSIDILILEKTETMKLSRSSRKLNPTAIGNGKGQEGVAECYDFGNTLCGHDDLESS